jgi:hypothetical protein
MKPAGGCGDGTTPVRRQPAAEPQFLPMQALAALINRQRMCDAVAHILEPGEKVQVVFAGHGVVHAEELVEQAPAVMQHEVECDQAFVEP